MAPYLAPVITLGGLGVLFGIALAFAAKRFYVPSNPLVEKVIAALPGANCGACGNAGCIAFAEALAQGKADLNSCTVCDAGSRSAVAQILNLTVAQQVKKVSTLHCQGGDRVKEKFLYLGMKDCIAANLVLGGHKNCTWGCLGFGTCAEACPFSAISMDEATGLPVVDEKKCTACGHCVAICPKHLYSLVPDAAKIYIACSSPDTGRMVMQVCGVGCIACKKCEKACEHGAMRVVDNLARVDYTKCNGCLACVEVCPTKVIRERRSMQQDDKKQK